MNEINELVEWGPYPYHLQNPVGRTMLTASDILKYHGYTYLADELKRFGNILIEIPPKESK